MDALSRASDHTVRAILTALCDDRSVRSKALAYLDKLEPQARTAATVLPTRKRKAAHSLSICVQCEDAFDEDDNVSKDCKYHTGVMEPDDESDFWADHDENCHGTIDSDWAREEYPDGFVWTCCDRLGTAPGCKRGRHQSNPEKSKKGSDAIYSAVAATEEDSDEDAGENSSEEEGGDGEEEG